MLRLGWWSSGDRFSGVAWNNSDFWVSDSCFCKVGSTLVVVYVVVGLSTGFYFVEVYRNLSVKGYAEMVGFFLLLAYLLYWFLNFILDMSKFLLNIVSWKSNLSCMKYLVKYQANLNFRFLQHMKLLLIVWNTFWTWNLIKRITPISSTCLLLSWCCVGFPDCFYFCINCLVLKHVVNLSSIISWFCSASMFISELASRFQSFVFCCLYALLISLILHLSFGVWQWLLMS